MPGRTGADTTTDEMETNGDIEALLRELEAEERSVSLRRRQIHERIALFPDTTGELERREREISAYRRELHARIDTLRAAVSALRAESARQDGVETAVGAAENGDDD